MTVTQIALAIALSAPFLSHRTVTRYAELVEHAARARRLPALMMVAIVDNESHWHAGASSHEPGLDESVGLGQIRLEALPACRKDVRSAACAAARATLLDPATNLAYVAAILAANRKHCGPRPVRYLAGYQGSRHCKPVGVTRRVMRRWQALERAVRARGFHTRRKPTVPSAGAGHGPRRLPGRVRGRHHKSGPRR